jgi:phosphatidylglycerophosphate synthase
MDTARRPLEVRSRAWPGKLARMVAAAGITPNQISIFSSVCAAAAGASLYWHRTQLGLLVVAAACIQLRLICNLIDGMVAVEGGQRTKSGEVFNDMPDRFSDLFILVPAGYALGGNGPMLGWLAGTFAVLTAYVRVLGGSLGLSQKFSGPMAKQHRMAVMTAACLAALVEIPFFGTNYSLWTGLALIAVGSFWTTFRRTRAIVQELERR